MFNGRTALVTGAGQGIGRAVAGALAKKGASVIAVSKGLENLQTLQHENPGMEIISCDLSNPIAVKEKLAKKCEKVDLLVNNAGVAYCESFIDIDLANFDKMMNLNVRSIIQISQFVIKSCLENSRPASIVNVSSQASMIALNDHTGYCATKAAVDALTRSMALEFGGNNIRVNSVNPTVVMTELGRRNWNTPEKNEPMLARIPLKRFAEVPEVVEPILFLLSDQSSMITGSHLPIDGGVLCN